MVQQPPYDVSAERFVQDRGVGSVQSLLSGGFLKLNG